MAQKMFKEKFASTDQTLLKKLELAEQKKAEELELAEQKKGREDGRVGRETR